MSIESFKVFISTSGFGDVDKAPLNKLEQNGLEVTLNPHGRKLTKDEVSALAKEYDALIAGTEDLTELVKQSESIKIISRVGVGIDSVPLKLCKEKNIKVTYTPEPVISAVAELTMSFIFNSLRSVTVLNNCIKNNQWKRVLGKEVGECVIGIIGFGNIGSKVAELLLPFHPKEILVFDMMDVTDRVSSLSKLGLNISVSNFKDLLSKSDLLTLHLPLNTDTTQLISGAEFNLMKTGAYLINTSRGGIVDEDALYNAVKKQKLSGAAMDVFEKEPYNGPLLELENVNVTAHIGSYTSNCRLKMEMEAVDEVLCFVKSEALKNEVPDFLS